MARSSNNEALSQPTRQSRPTFALRLRGIPNSAIGCNSTEESATINDGMVCQLIPYLGGYFCVFILPEIVNALVTFLRKLSFQCVYRVYRTAPMENFPRVFSILPARGYGCALATCWARCAWRSRGDARLGSGAWWDGGMKLVKPTVNKLGEMTLVKGILINLIGINEFSHQFMYLL